jgi:hypothetical protein
MDRMGVLERKTTGTYSNFQNNVPFSAAGQFRLGRQELANKSA